MDPKEFEALKATFPWTERQMIVNGMGGLVQVLDNRGNEVPLFTMTRFLAMITNKLMSKDVQEAAAAT
jgi:hypothetical protein